MCNFSLIYSLLLCFSLSMFLIFNALAILDSNGLYTEISSDGEPDSESEPDTESESKPPINHEDNSECKSKNYSCEHSVHIYNTDAH